MLVSVVMPCLNEAENIDLCVNTAISTISKLGVAGEVVVVDNDSSDGSAKLAALAGARVVHEKRRGYGSAYQAGFAAARGDYIVMADADLSYDFGEIPRFLAALEAGADMIVGDRMHHIHAGAMPWHHRYIGNPVLSGMLNVMFHTGVNDAHCGMRAFRRDLLDTLDLRTTGMEFASEMVIRAAKTNLVIKELPIEYHPRGGHSKLSSFRDGWRHLRFLLLHAPNHLFIAPGALISLLGGLVSVAVVAHLNALGRNWDLHSLIAGCLLLIAGAQIFGLGVCAHAYNTYFMGQRDAWFDRVRTRLRLEHGLILGGLLTALGCATTGSVVLSWVGGGLGNLAQENTAVVGATLVVLGIQVIFSSFLLSILGLRRPL